MDPSVVLGWLLSKLLDIVASELVRRFRKGESRYSQWERVMGRLRRMAYRTPANILTPEQVRNHRILVSLDPALESLKERIQKEIEQTGVIAKREHSAGAAHLVFEWPRFLDAARDLWGDDLALEVAKCYLEEKLNIAFIVMLPSASDRRGSAMIPFKNGLENCISPSREICHALLTRDVIERRLRPDEFTTIGGSESILILRGAATDDKTDDDLLREAIDFLSSIGHVIGAITLFDWSGRGRDGMVRDDRMKYPSERVLIELDLAQREP